MSRLRPLLPIFLAALFTLPAWVVALAGIPLSPPASAAVAGAAILAASFLLLWACDAAQKDISQALALAVVALVAVLPEYAVDMYFTWQAGRDPQYAGYAIANMTGANRLLIGVAWVLVAVIYWLKSGRVITLDREHLTEISFLAAATLYAIVIPIKGTLTWVDGLVLLGIYAAYVVIVARRPVEEGEAEGPAALIIALPKAQRIAATVGLFAFAAAVIVMNAERFSEGLVQTGKLFGINEFLLVQWLAPIASEAPEFIVAIMFALRVDANQSLGSLLSAKLNQWTLLVGMVPLVFALSHGSLQHPIPMGPFQMHEILLTAAQSLLAVVILSTLRLTVGHALLLFGLFVGQLLAPSIVTAYLGGEVLGMQADLMHPLFSLLYLACAVALLVERPYRLDNLVKRQRAAEPTLLPCANAADCPRWRAPDRAACRCGMIPPDQWPDREPDEAPPPRQAAAG